ncbi:MAG: hypothetical protein KKE11_06055, partial [Gammaproteobacteria bacterium]|nr:hypothetical protein [Gammaproteobacteria bacterium]
ASAISADEVNFSKIETIKTWVSSKYYTPKKHNRYEYDRVKYQMDVIQNQVFAMVPQNPNSLSNVNPIVNDHSVTRNFGKTFQTISDIELPFLQFVHKISLDPKKTPIVVEIAAADGLVSWKVPLAFEWQNQGHLYANEFSSIMLTRFEANIDALLKFDPGIDKGKIITKIGGSCFDILEKEPELKENVDALYVQKLEHFFNPIQHQKFIALIDELLALGGRAFLCADSFRFRFDDKKLLYGLYLALKANRDLYPGLSGHIFRFTQYREEPNIVRNTSVSNVMRPDDNDELETRFLSVIENPDDGSRTVEQLVMHNCFSPEIYQNLIIAYNSMKNNQPGDNQTELKVVDSFYMDVRGNRIESENELDGRIIHAAVIIEKIEKTSSKTKANKRKADKRKAKAREDKEKALEATSVHTENGLFTSSNEAADVATKKQDKNASGKKQKILDRLYKVLHYGGLLTSANYIH